MIKFRKIRWKTSKICLSFLYQPCGARVRIQQLLPCQLLRACQIKRLIPDACIQLQAEDVFNVSFVDTQNGRKSQQAITLHDLVLAQRVHFLFVAFRVVTERSNVELLSSE